MNAKEELLKHIGDREVKYVRIIFDHSFRNRVTNASVEDAMRLIQNENSAGTAAQERSMK
jgi:hypothetical protein